MRRALVCAVILLVAAPAAAQEPAPPADQPAAPAPKKKKKKKRPKLVTEKEVYGKKKPGSAEPTPAPVEPTPPPPGLLAPAPPPVAPAAPPPPPPVAPAAPAPATEPAVQVGAAAGPPKPESPDIHFDATAVPPPDTEPLPTFSVRLEPSWGYRRFLDTEGSSTDKRFGTPGVFLVGAAAEVYPFASMRDGLLRDVGLTGSYFRAAKLTLTDFDTNKDVDASWYAYSVGLRVRLLGRTGHFGLGLFGGYERWSFSFDSPPAPVREIPIAEYTIAGGGVDARESFGRLSLFASAAYLQPLTVGALGDRLPQSRAYGARGVLGLAFRVSGGFEIDAHATYTLVRLTLDPVPGRTDEPGRVFDQYLVSTLGLKLSL